MNKIYLSNFSVNNWNVVGTTCYFVNVIKNKWKPINLINDSDCFENKLNGIRNNKSSNNNNKYVVCIK